MKKSIRIVLTIVVLLVLGVAVAALIAKRNKDNKKDDNTTPGVAVFVQDPFASQPAQGAQVTPTPTPTPSSASGGSGPTATPSAGETVHTFATSSATLRIVAPSSWQPEQSEIAGRKIIAFKANGRVIGSVEYYENTDDTIATIEQQLRASSSVRGVESATLGGSPALQYRLTGGGTMIATVKNKTLYYISGQLAANPANISF